MPCLLRTIAVGPVGANCSIVKCTQTGEALLVDPGGDAEQILALAAELEARVVLIAHTHGHFDHILATREVAAALSAPLAIHAGDLGLYRGLGSQARYFGLQAETPPEPHQVWSGGEVLRFGALRAQVLHTPGHTPGSVGLYLGDTGGTPLLLAGDTLFAGGIGRSDFQGGSQRQILASIRETLFRLPDDTVVIAGHGPDTTIGRERDSNPYVGCHARRR